MPISYGQQVIYPITQTTLDISRHIIFWARNYPPEKHHTIRESLKRIGIVLCGFIVGGSCSALGYKLLSFNILWITILILIYIIYRLQSSLES